MKRALFLFRRDLRLQDNNGLAVALRAADEVIPCFILDPRQAGPHPYRSGNALQFMSASLSDLQEQLRQKGGRLHILAGEAEQVVAELLPGVDLVVVNDDYTPFSRRRDEALAECCATRGVEFLRVPDALLHEPGTVVKDDGEPYTVFTPYYKRALTVPVAAPAPLPDGRFAVLNLPDAQLPPARNERLALAGGREEALRLLDDLQRFSNYEDTRDFPAKETTKLSAHNKFGTVSAREVYRAMKEALGPFHPLVRQLYWRDFFTQIAYHFPHVFGKSFREEFDAVRWECDGDHFAAWCDGRTGFPLIDAGMRELVTTGYMHNRVRMVVASFLTKDLHVDWRLGERFFAQHLIDYDPCVNNGSWQWAASTGCDAQPYFRIFNPWLQQQRFDSDCTYIKEWVPELKQLSPSEIHTPTRPSGPDYPVPIVDHQEEKAETLRRFNEVRK